MGSRYALTKHPLLLAVGGVATLTLLALGAVLFLEPKGAPAPATATAGAPAPVVPSPITLPDGSTEERAAVAPAPLLPEAAERPASLGSSDVQERRKALEPLRGEVFAGLASLARRVEACHLAAGSFGLDLETLDGAVRITGVRFPDPSQWPEGSAPPQESPQAIGCVRGVLEGAVLAAPSARPGRRWDMMWPGNAAP